MNSEIFAAVIFYELITIIGVGMWIHRKQAGQRGQDGFTHAGHSLPMTAVAMTLALSVLGAVHIIGVFEMTFIFGAAVLWFSFGNALVLIIVCLTTGRWVRRLRATTVPQLLEDAYGLEVRLLVSCVMIGGIFGIITLEAQGLGVLVTSMAGWQIQTGILLGGVLGMLYVLIAGLREISYLNMINAVIMYAAVILSVIVLAFVLPGDGYNTVADVHRDTGNGHMLNMFGSAGVILMFGIPTVIAVGFSSSASQMLLQTAMSAKSEQTLRRTMWLAVPVNGMFAVFGVILALTAMTLPEYAASGPKVATTNMIVGMLPGWLSALLLAAFVGVILSTFAITALTSSTLFASDIYRRLYRPQASEAHMTRVTRIAIVIFCAMAMALAMFMPPILGGVAWLLAWIVPIFWVLVFALVWKRNTRVVVVALLVAWILNMAWSFTNLPAAVGMAGVHNAYITFFVSLVILVLGILALGGKPGLLKEQV